MDKSKKESKKKKELKECEKLRDEYLAGWKRTQADFLNYKKEEEERIGELMKYSKEEIILTILPILDNLYIAESKIPEDLKNNESVKGILQIENQILDFLKTQGIEEIKSIREKFNPEFHEAIEIIENKDSESEIVTEEIKKGYIFNGKVIRAAKVRVIK